MKYKYTGRVFDIKEFELLIFDLAITPIGTVSEGKLKTGEYIYVTPYKDRWAELIEEGCTLEEK